MNEEKEQVFEALDFYLVDVDNNDIIGAIEDLVYDYIKTRDISVRYIEMY